MRLELETRRFYLGRDYADAVEAAGGLPVHIPLIPEPAFVASVVEGLDGVLLPGCDTDVDPAYYDEDPHPSLKKVVPEKDETDMLVLAEADKLKLPVLAICYGMQVLNVARGGNLIQDIRSQVQNCIQHDQGVPLDRNSHAISIGHNSILGDLARLGSDSARIKVNSHHHQAIRTTGRDLNATAWANDGIVEGIEDIRPSRFVLGVQWHPELNWKSDRFSRGIFDAFIARCAEMGMSRAADIAETQQSLTSV